jgi:hypothetical protein
MLKDKNFVAAQFLWSDRYFSTAAESTASSWASSDAEELFVVATLTFGAGAGAYLPTSFDIKVVTPTKMARNTNTNPMPTIIKLSASDINSDIVANPLSCLIRLLRIL